MKNSSNPPDSACPICGASVPPNPRYPRAVCAACLEKAVAPDGRRLRFFNLELSGGYGAEYADTGEAYASHMCQIDGKPCWADEARFGGIVAWPMPEANA